MKLIIGGCAQGKLNYVLEREGRENCIILDGSEETEILNHPIDAQGKKLILGKFHLWVKKCMQQKSAPEENQKQETVSETPERVLPQIGSGLQKDLDQERKKIDPEVEIKEFLEKHPDCIIISDEIGNGIVPMDAFERAYREKTGRMLVELAKKADEVVRVICGIGQKIK